MKDLDTISASENLLDSTCGLCQQQADILEHLFWHYETARLVWFASPTHSKHYVSKIYKRFASPHPEMFVKDLLVLKTYSASFQFYLQHTRYLARDVAEFWFLT